MYKAVVFLGIIAFGIAGYFLMSSNSEKKPDEPILIFTQIPAKEYPGEVENKIIIPGYQSSRIVSISYENRENGIRNLTPDFHSACSPSISFDNKLIVFAGKMDEKDPWQIWLMNKNGSGLKKVTNTSENCLVPSFLPGGSIVFSKEWSNNIGRGYALFTCKPDGSELYQITFHPHNDLYPTVLHDGRIFMISQQVYPDIKPPSLMVLRPDGTQYWSFFYPNDQSTVKSVVRETNDKQLIFVEGIGEADRIVARPYANPLKDQKTLTTKPANRIHSIEVLDSNNYVFSYQSLKNGVFSLYTLNDQGIEELIYMDDEYHSIEPVFVRKREIPRKLPSTINWEKGTGKLICQNSNSSNIEIEGDPQTKFIQVFGIDKMLSEFEVAEDGSFYLEVESDLPVRFQSLDEKREILRGPSSWIWLRNNERRGCVGCHEKKEIAPENLVPQAISNPPILVTDSSALPSSQNIVWKMKKGGDHEN